MKHERLELELDGKGRWADSKDSMELLQHVLGAQWHPTRTPQAAVHLSARLPARFSHAVEVLLYGRQFLERPAGLHIEGIAAQMRLITPPLADLALLETVFAHPDTNTKGGACAAVRQLMDSIGRRLGDAIAKLDRGPAGPTGR